MSEDPGLATDKPGLRAGDPRTVERVTFGPNGCYDGQPCGRAGGLIGFVVLSDKYLRSPFCMFELSEIWRNSWQDDKEFIKRIRVYTLPAPRSGRRSIGLKYAIHWKEEYNALNGAVKKHGYDVLGELDAQQFRYMSIFARNVGNILSYVADRLLPHSLDALQKYGFDDAAG